MMLEPTNLLAVSSIPKPLGMLVISVCYLLKVPF